MRTILPALALILTGCTELLETTGTVLGGGPTLPGERLAMITTQTDPSNTERIGTTSPEVLADARRRGAEECVLIIEFYITGNSDRLEPERLRTRIDQILPPDFDGYAMLDWESDGILTALNSDPSSAKFRRAQERMVEAIRFAKSLRPNAKWGYYDVPHVRFDFKNRAGDYVQWHEAPEAARARRLAASTQATTLLREVDYFAPSIYDMWHEEDSPGRDGKGQRAFVRESVAWCVRASRGKPVLPVVWHRVQSSRWHQQRAITLRNANKLFSEREWLDDQIRPALAAGADGIIWWGADLKMANRNMLRALPVVREEQPYTSDREHNLQLLDSLHRRYAGVLTDAVDR
ncbi:MAG: hypothetical protein HKO59_07435 [Phycisphaerales bacterium]|nr:hypothetical protein [Phycisphaerales bacterium]